MKKAMLKGKKIEELRLLSRAIFIIDRNDVIRYVECPKGSAAPGR